MEKSKIQINNETKEFSKRKMGEEIDFPLVRKKKFFGMIKSFDLMRNKTGNPIKENMEKPKEPIALIIKDNFEVEIREAVPEGVIKVERRLAQDKTETVRILNPKSKLLSFNFGKETVRGWIIDEKEAVALPTQVKHDSWELKRIFDALVMNYKSMDDNSKNKWWFYVIVGIVIILFGSMLFGVSIPELLGIETAKETVVVVRETAETTTTPIIGMIRGWF